MRDAMKLQEIKRRIEWAVMIAAMSGVLVLGTAGCTNDPLGPQSAVQIEAEVAEEQAQQDAAALAGERQRDKNARSNGSAAID